MNLKVTSGGIYYHPPSSTRPKRREDICDPASLSVTKPFSKPFFKWGWIERLDLNSLRIEHWGLSIERSEVVTEVIVAQSNTNVIRFAANTKNIKVIKGAQVSFFKNVVQRIYSVSKGIENKIIHQDKKKKKRNIVGGGTRISSGERWHHVI